MKLMLLVLLAASLCIFSDPALAQGKNQKGKGKNKNNGNIVKVSPGPSSPAAKNCPPGLAKSGCIPPGQLKKYARGDVISDYRWIDNPSRWGLKSGGYYVRAGDYVYQIDKDTRKVLNLIGAVADIMN